MKNCNFSATKNIILLIKVMGNILCQRLLVCNVQARLDFQPFEGVRFHPPPNKGTRAHKTAGDRAYVQAG